MTQLGVALVAMRLTQTRHQLTSLAEQHPDQTAAFRQALELVEAAAAIVAPIRVSDAESPH